jgi:hypothetical protein
VGDQVLLRFLENGLINVGGDDTKLEKLQLTAADLAATLKKNPAKAMAYSLVAFDPKVPADEPVVAEALDALKKRWTSYHNTFSGKPVAVVRAMLLDALNRSAQEDPKVAVCFSATARNALPFIELGDEKEIWSDVVVAIERLVDEQAEAAWATPSSISVQPLEFTPIQKITIGASAIQFDKGDLETKIGNAGTQAGGNGYYPHQNPQQWASQFGSIVANALVEAVSKMKTSGQAIDFNALFQQFAKDVSGNVESALEAVSNATAGLQRRTNLLWWKEAGFSPSMRLSYRDLPITIASPLMAFDLHQQIPTFSPPAVAAFLREAVLCLPTADNQQKYPIRDLLNELCADAKLTDLREATTDLVSPPTGRSPLLSLIGYPDDYAKIDKSAFRSRTGLPPDSSLTAPEWAVWIFREFQAARAAAGDANTKRRGRKGRGE